MKLIINYDPIDGETVPDGKVFSYVKELAVIAETRAVPMEVTIGSFMVIEEVRALIFEGALSHEDIMFKFEGREIRIDKFGTPAYWPAGFCDAYGKILRRMIKSKK